jgi:hypothetical protein
MQFLSEFSNEPLVGVLLQELAVTDAEPKIVSDNGKVLRFESTLQDTKPNRNKRLYGEDVLSEAIRANRIQEMLRTRTLLGEAGHPFSEDMKRQMQIDMSRVSHLITELNPPKGGVVRGVVETAATSCGSDMYGLIAHNKSNVAFSMRGMGGVKRVPGKDLVEVTKPLALVTYDWVVFPSHFQAYAEINKPSSTMEGATPVTSRAALDYARDQSQNVRAIVEQFEIDGANYQLTEDQASVIIRSNEMIVKTFLEDDIRREFRHAMLKM